MQIFMSFYDEKLKLQICYSFTLLIPKMFFIHLKWRSGCFRPHQVLQILMVQVFFPNSTGPWPRLQKGRKIPEYMSTNHVKFN